MHSFLQMIIVLSICLKCHCFPLEEHDSNGSKLEKLQIDGTVRNVDESNLVHRSNSRSQLFDQYWTKLNWGQRADLLPDHTTRTSSPNKPVVVEAREPRRHYMDELVDSEVEFIDPSKASEQLANVRFMRLEQMKKDI